MLLLLCLGLLSGCYTTKAELTVNGDGTVTGSSTVGVPKGTPKAQQKKIFKRLDNSKNPAVAVENWSNKKLIGRKLIFTNAKPAAILKGTGLKLEGAEGKYTLSGTVKPAKQLAKVGKNKVSWTVSLTFPHAVESATPGVAVEGNTAVISNKFFSKGGELLVAPVAAETETGTDPDYEPKAPPAPPTFVVEERSPIPGYIFMAMIILGLIAGIGGRFIDFSQLLKRNKK